MYGGSPGILTKEYPYPGYCATILQKTQKFRLRVWGSYRTYRSSGHGYECPTELTEVLGRVIPGVNTPGMVCAYPTEHDLEIFTP